MYQDVCPTHARFLAVDIAKLNRKGLCIYHAYARIFVGLGFAGIYLVYVVVFGILLVKYEGIQIGTSLLI